MIKVSVIIPIYNMDRYIEECLESIIHQTLFDEMEVICVDDSSTDKSWDIITRYSKQYRNIKVEWQEKKGPGAARNKGISLASGEYVCMMDADDYYADFDSIEILYKNAQDNKAVVCGGNLLGIFPDGRIEPEIDNFLEDGFCDSIENPRMYGQTRFLYYREFLLENKLFYPEYVRFEDPPFVLKTLLLAKQYYVISRNVYVIRKEYKEIFTNHEVAMGILNGILECEDITRQYNLKKLYDECLKNILKYTIEYYHAYALNGDEDIWKLIVKINGISDDWGYEDSGFFSNAIEYRAFFDELKKKLELVNLEKKIVVYGTGIVAKGLYDSHVIDCNKIIGFAVSEAPALDYIYGKPVGNIELYLHRDDCFIIIAANEKNAKEMKQLLLSHSYTNYWVVDSWILVCLSKLLNISEE